MDMPGGHPGTDGQPGRRPTARGDFDSEIAAVPVLSHVLDSHVRMYAMTHQLATLEPVGKGARS
jgi:hypothetical protein